MNAPEMKLQAFLRAGGTLEQLTEKYAVKCKRYQMGAHEALDEGETKIFKRFLELFRAQYPSKLYVYPKLVTKEEAAKRGAVDSTKRKE